MDNTLTAEQRAEIQKRVDAATPGPWEAGKTLCEHKGEYCAVFCYETNIYPPLGESGPVAVVSGEDGANGEFIAHAPDDVRALLTTCTALEARAVEAEKQRTDAKAAKADETKKRLKFETALYQAGLAAKRGDVEKAFEIIKASGVYGVVKLAVAEVGTPAPAAEQGERANPELASVLCSVSDECPMCANEWCAQCTGKPCDHGVLERHMEWRYPKVSEPGAPVMPKLPDGMEWVRGSVAGSWLAMTDDGQRMGDCGELGGKFLWRIYEGPMENVVDSGPAYSEYGAQTALALALAKRGADGAPVMSQMPDGCCWRTFRTGAWLRDKDGNSLVQVWREWNRFMFEGPGIPKRSADTMEAAMDAALTAAVARLDEGSKES